MKKLLCTVCTTANNKFIYLCKLEEISGDVSNAAWSKWANLDEVAQGLAL